MAESFSGRLRAVDGGLMILGRLPSSIQDAIHTNFDYEVSFNGSLHISRERKSLSSILRNVMMAYYHKVQPPFDSFDDFYAAEIQLMIDNYLTELNGD